MSLLLFLLPLWLAPSSAQAVDDDKKPTTEQEEETEGYHEVVVVTAARTEQPLGDAISMVTAFSREDLLESPTLVLDEHLRRVPGFSLFRRSSSLVAHPTTQGVSLRGIGPSGASRSLVLWDGVPLNDPFGNWVYWNRLPRLALGSVEVSRGATSQLYGSSALGGTIQLSTRPPESDTLEVRAQLGSRQTYDVDVFASDRGDDWSYLVSGRVFGTDGYIQVAEENRGAVDEPAGVDFRTFLGRAEYKSFYAGFNFYDEERRNGTAIQRNDSRMFLFETGVHEAAWSFDFYSQHGELNSSFSRILPDRSAEFPTAQQHFPSLGLGSAFTYRPGHGLLLGVDWRYVSWEEQNQNLAGIFIQDLLTPHPRFDVLLGARVDVWENQTTQTSFNPRAGILFRASNAVTVRSSIYRGFRAPSLNELYRPFRVGNIRTEANPELEEEHLWGVEGGVDLHPHRSLLVRLNGFWNSLRDPVANVTLSVTPSLILRQRQNLGSITAKGVEAEVSYRWGSAWDLWVAYLYSNSRIDDTGLRVPQVPLNQASMGIGYQGPIQVSAGLRFVGEQFEDDRNQLPLEGFVVLDLWFQRALNDRFALFFAVENVLDRIYPVGRTPTATIGAPRMVHGGVDLRLSF